MTKLKKTYPIILLILALIVIFNSTSCEKDDDSDTSSQPLVYTSLTTDNDTIFVGNTTIISANAAGYNLIFNWSASAGDIIGGGAQITYLATPCTPGDNTIICTVEDGNNASETKTIIITVF